MTEPARDEGWRGAVERLAAAMNTLMSGDASAIKALYSHRDDVTAFFGWGGYEKGWPQVSRRWDWAAAQFKGGGPVTYEHLTATVAPGLAVTTHIESTRVRLAGAAEPATWSNRVTHVFRLEDGMRSIVRALNDDAGLGLSDDVPQHLQSGKDGRIASRDVQVTPAVERWVRDFYSRDYDLLGYA